MATLNLKQKADLQNNATFQQRFNAACAKIARYHIDSQPTALAGFNEEKRKLTAYARKIMEQGGTVSGAHIADFVASFVEDLSGKLQDNAQQFNAETNQLSDQEISDGGTAIVVFARQAGVKAGDSTRQIVL